MLLRRAQREIGGREAAEAPRGARSARPVGEAARSKPNEAGRAASELASDAERPCRIVDTERSEVRSRRPEGLKRRGAHEGRRQWRKQAVVSPMKQGVPQASLRAQWNDHAELWNSAKRSADAEHRASEAQGGAKTRNDHAELRVGAKSEAAKRLKPRGAHEARALWAKQRGVSPMRQGEPQASLRAMRNDHAELWTRSEAKSAGAEHRTAKGECGAKRRKGG